MKLILCNVALQCYSSVIRRYRSQTSLGTYLLAVLAKNQKICHGKRHENNLLKKIDAKRVCYIKLLAGIAS
jgi:hypothetical protein